MFTGLVEEVGTLADREFVGLGARLRIACVRVAEGLTLGDSVSVNGACLTVVAFDLHGFAVDCVAETLNRTALGRTPVGDRVNLERALRIGDRLGGHMVQGHIDGTGTITSMESDGHGTRMRVALPTGLRRFIVEKGSVAIEGVSLTIAERHDDGLSVALVPHTMAHTTLDAGAVGRDVNVEVDVVAKYVAELVAPYRLGAA